MSNLTEAGSVDTARSSQADIAQPKHKLQLLTGRAAALAPSLTPAGLAWRKLRKNQFAVVGGIIMIFLYTSAIFAPFLSPYDPTSQDSTATFHPPSSIHFLPWPTIYATKMSFDQFHERHYVEDVSKPEPLKFFHVGDPYKMFWLIPCKIHFYGIDGEQRINILGTDIAGRDYFSRLLYGSQISLSVGLIGIFITFTLGLIVGGISGFYGGIVDTLLMRICETIMSLPDFYLLLALAALLPPNMPPALVYILIIVILSFVGWAGTARIIRGIVLSVREREYVEAARALGVPDHKIIIRHILPSTFTYAIVAATLTIPGYILAESSLSFLNLGIRDPIPSLGNMLSSSQDLATLEQRLWLLAPGVLIIVTTMAYNFLGDGLRDALDPKSK